MTDATIRDTLGSAVGTLDRLHAILSRAECGPQRELVARARAELAEQAAALLALRARLFGEPGPRARVVPLRPPGGDPC